VLNWQISEAVSLLAQYCRIYVESLALTATQISELIYKSMSTNFNIIYIVYIMAIWVVEFSNGGYKIRKVFA
jgi:hypothetical protein